ncbi:hypothetical protein ES703_28179 [subsurface metagenome]
MGISVTRLRQNLYSILDEVIETGIPIEIERKGHRLKIVPENPTGKLERLEKHEIIKGDPEELVHLDWFPTWSGEKNL